MKPKKYFGQHFLKNDTIASSIASLLPQEPSLPVLEIGPGKGVLTKFLTALYPEVFAVEVDSDMFEYLIRNGILQEHQIWLKNILKCDFEHLFGGDAFYLIGNYPYNISSQIVFKMLDNKELVPFMCGMFQKEMAERICASPGGKDYGVISVLSQVFYDCHIAFNVKASEFNPPPKVESAVIVMERKTPPEGLNYKQFRRIVKQAFNQRRKMMRNTLKGIFSEEVLKDEFFSLRPEKVSIEDFVRLSKLVEN